MNELIRNAWFHPRTSILGVLCFLTALGSQLIPYFMANEGANPWVLALGVLVMLKGFVSADAVSVSKVVLLIFVALPFVSGCAIGARDPTLVTAESKMVTRYEADHANLKAVAQAEDAALAQAVRNDVQNRLDQRVANITALVNQHPELAGQGIQALAQANSEFNALIQQQAAAQNSFQAIVTQSELTNISQARALDSAIRKYDNTAPFNAAATVTSAINAITPLIPPPKVTTISTTPVVKSAGGVIPEPK